MVFEARPDVVPEAANDNQAPVTGPIGNVGLYTIGVAAWVTLAWTAGVL